MPLNAKIYSQIPDSLGNDTIKIMRFIDHEIQYKAKDSIRLNMKLQKVFLYGTGFVKYGEIELKAGLIEYDFKNKQVHARPRLDSVGKEVEFPQFTDGNEVINAKLISYNFETKKAFIKGSRAKQGEGFIHFEKIKVYPNKEVHGLSGKYTTCDAENPHYHFQISRAIVKPSDKIIAGPLMLYIADVPTPLALPFGFFPNNRKKGSGIIIPTYDNTVNNGSGLVNGGYYFPYKDIFDMQLTGSIYTRGTWGIRSISRYRKIYKYDGSLNLTYGENIFGDKNLPELTGFSKTKTFSIQWSHRQDQKARPNSSFNASVNYNSNQRDDINARGGEFLNNSFNSAISYSKTFPNTPFRLNASILQNQTASQKPNENSQNYNSINLTLPDVSLTMNRIYPLKSFHKKSTNQFTKGLSKIFLSWTSNTKNSVSFIDTAITLNNISSLINKSRNGVNHELRTGTSLRILNRIVAINPNISINEKWYFQELNKRYNATDGKIYQDTLRGISHWNRALTSKFHIDASSKFYGMYRFASFLKGKRETVFRHVITPNIGFDYIPEFNSYIDSVYNSNLNRNEGYSRLSLGVYGAPSSNKFGNLSYGFVNSIEMKMKIKTDTGMVYKKFSIIDNLSINSGYNLLADSLNMSQINVSARTTLFKIFNISGDASFNPYQTDSGVTINKYLLNETGKLAKMTRANLRLGFNLNQEKFKKKIEDEEKKNGPSPETEHAKNNPNQYIDFDIPWNIGVNYTFNLENRTNSFYRDTTIFRQYATFSGNISLTRNWKIGINTSYDITDNELSYTTLNIHRQLHCWEMSINWVPFGPRQSYNFQINVKSAVLQDLKFNKDKTWFDR